MKKVILTTLILTLLASVALAAPYGFLYTDTKEPVAASALGSYSKTATGSNMSILGLVALGDGSIKTVAGNNGITKIKYVDKHTSGILSIIVTETYTIYGD